MLHAQRGLAFGHSVNRANATPAQFVSRNGQRVYKRVNEFNDAHQSNPMIRVPGIDLQEKKI